MFDECSYVNSVVKSEFIFYTSETKIHASKYKDFNIDAAYYYILLSLDRVFTWPEKRNISPLYFIKRNGNIGARIEILRSLRKKFKNSHG